MSLQCTGDHDSPQFAFSLLSMNCQRVKWFSVAFVIVLNSVILHFECHRLVQNWNFGSPIPTIIIDTSRIYARAYKEERILPQLGDIPQTLLLFLLLRPYSFYPVFFLPLPHFCHSPLSLLLCSLFLIDAVSLLKTDIAPIPI